METIEKRKAISKRTRFEVFKRDSFCCQYCSAKPPLVPLEIDHIIPISKGGDNKIDNLITACFDCNRGKSDVELSSLPSTLIDKIERKKLATDQYKQYKALLKKQKKQIDSDIDYVESVFSKFYEDRVFTERFRFSIEHFLKHLSVEELYNAMAVACSKIYYDENKAVKYFCGICWNKIKES